MTTFDELTRNRAGEDPFKSFVLVESACVHALKLSKQKTWADGGASSGLPVIHDYGDGEGARNVALLHFLLQRIWNLKSDIANDLVNANQYVAASATSESFEMAKQGWIDAVKFHALSTEENLKDADLVHMSATRRIELISEAEGARSWLAFVCS